MPLRPGSNRSKKVKIPSYRKHSSGQAFVEHGGKRIYLGRHGTPESRDRYKAFLGKIASRPATPIPVDRHKVPSVSTLIALYLDHCKKYYVNKNKEPHAEYTSNVEAMRIVTELYGPDLAEGIGPTWLLAIQARYVEAGYARPTVNAHVGRVRRFIRWCAVRELVRPETYHALLCVPPLREGKTEAPEPAPIRPVTWEQVAKTIPYMSPIVSAMVQVQWMCGMRPAEVCAMTLAEIDRSDEIWIYSPANHKTAWRGQVLMKAIPKRVQVLLQQFLDRPAEYALFSPRESEAWRNEQAAIASGKNRKTKIYPSEKRRRAKAIASTKMKTPRCRDHYDTHSYGRAIYYAIKKAAKKGVAIDHWTPNQLRHGISTDLSKDLGQQKAQRWLGHAELETTSIYTEITRGELVAIAKELDARWQQQPLQVPECSETHSAI